MFSTAEKQLVAALKGFQTHYALMLGLSISKVVSREHLEHFGHAWMGAFKVDWAAAFERLTDLGLLAQSAEGYALTEAGQRLAEAEDESQPFFKYEYDAYFDAIQRSAAHAEFCRRVYGEDLAQHGLINADELSVLLAQLQAQKPSKILDLGCGNGSLTAHIAAQVPCAAHGIDISAVGIAAANKIAADKPYLSFSEGNFNALDLRPDFDAVLFLDTLYYVKDLGQTISDAKAGLRPQGKIYAYFSQWIMNADYAYMLAPDATKLAKVLQTQNLAYQAINLTASGLAHWKTKCDVLVEMRPAFEAEGNIKLWEYRYNEALRYSTWGDDKYSRYLYVIG